MAGALSAPAELLAEDRSLPASIELHRVRVPLRTAHRSAHGTEHERDSVLVRWEHVDGAVGWGECPALTGDGYVTEPIDRAWTALRDDLAPAALRGVPPDPATVTAHPASTASIADARLDAVLRAHGRSLALDWGVSSSVRSTSVVALAGLAPQVVVERALAAVPASAVKAAKLEGDSVKEGTTTEPAKERVWETASPPSCRMLPVSAPSEAAARIRTKTVVDPSVPALGIKSRLSEKAALSVRG